MASPGNQHCANCIDTLSFPMAVEESWTLVGYRFNQSVNQTAVKCE